MDVRDPGRGHATRVTTRTAPRAAEQLGLAHEVTRHGPVRSLEEAAAARGVEPGQLVKTMVVRVSDGEYVFVLVPGDREIAWPKLRALLGVNRLTMASADTAYDVTGYVRGTITPLGSLTRCGSSPTPRFGPDQPRRRGARRRADRGRDRPGRGPGGDRGRRDRARWLASAGAQPPPPILAGCRRPGGCTLHRSVSPAGAQPGRRGPPGAAAAPTRPARTGPQRRRPRAGRRPACSCQNPPVSFWMSLLPCPPCRPDPEPHGNLRVSERCLEDGPPSRRVPDRRATGTGRCWAPCRWSARARCPACR